jgi:hypothetical protein
MATISPSTRPYSDRIAPGWMWPTSQSAAAAAADYFHTAKPVHVDLANQYHAAAGQLSVMTDGAASEAMVTAHQGLAVDHTNIGEIVGYLGTAVDEVTDLGHGLARALDTIDYEAHQEILAAPPEDREALIDAAHARALSAHADFTIAVTNYHTYVQGQVEPLAAAVLTGGGPPRGTGDGDTTQALSNDPQHRSDKSDAKAGEATAAGVGQHTPGAAGNGQGDPAHRADLAGGPGVSGSGDPHVRGELSDGPIAAAPMPQPSVSSAAVSGGGLSGGGLGGGRLSGLSSANPLPSLASGLGETGSPAGSGGMPIAASPAAANPSAFGRGVAAGSSLGGTVPPVTQPAAPPVTVAERSAAVPPPPAAAAAAGSSVPAAVASSAVHLPASAVPSGAPDPAPMMMPPPGMGAPAAVPAVSGSPATAPATGSSMSQVGAPAAAAGGNAGPTLVPASVVAAGRVSPAAAQRESPDVAAANRLAFELQKSCERVKYPLDWAVGVFRSPGGSETVVMSNDGAGFVPAGVFLPRSVRLLVADTLVDKKFRSHWFGWNDPAQVMVAYAGLRARSEWRLIAAATTGPVSALREARVEHGEPCDPRRSPLGDDWTAPLLDALHVHRLQLEHPDLYDRLEKLAEADPGYRKQVVLRTSLEVMNSLPRLGVEIPPELRTVSAAVKAGTEAPPRVWTNYVEASTTAFLAPTLKRPGLFTTAERPEDVPSEDHAVYAGRWQLARAMEHIGGYSRQPLPLADMVYAAFAIGRDIDVVQMLERDLSEVEGQLRGL